MIVSRPKRSLLNRACSPATTEATTHERCRYETTTRLVRRGWFDANAHAAAVQNGRAVRDERWGWAVAVVSITLVVLVWLGNEQQQPAFRDGLNFMEAVLACTGA